MPRVLIGAATLARTGGPFRDIFAAAGFEIASVEDITKLHPDVVLLSSEPFPFQEKHLNEMKELLPDSKIYFVDGEMFSWYGSRLLHAADYFQSLPF